MVSAVAVPEAVSMAAAAPTMIKIPANFAYVSHVQDDRCYWGIGVEYPSVPKATSYTIDYYDGLYQQWEATGASVPLSAADKIGHGMNWAGITGGGGPAPCGSGDATEGGRFTKPIKAWANFPGKAPTTGAIEGIVTDEDGNPFDGATINASGPTPASAVSGPGGLYYMTVDAGSYHVVPEDPSVKKSSITPADATVSVTEGGSSTADFKINSGLQVTIDLSDTTVPASGFAIVKGTITTTRYGKPAPLVTVQLEVDQTNPGAALTTAPKVAICGPTGRIWPEGNLTDLDGAPVKVSTDATGKYAFTLTVGTVPGTWSLNAWGLNPDGSYDTNIDATDDKSLTVSPVPAPTALKDFLTELKALHGSKESSELNPQTPVDFSNTMATFATDRPLHLGGLIFSVGAGADGQDVVIAPDTTQFSIASNGNVKRSATVDDSVIVDPQEWHSLTGTSLNAEMQNGTLNFIPTVGEWASGKAVDPYWSMKPQTLSIAFPALAWWGWANPPLPGATIPTGYCQ